MGGLVGTALMVYGGIALYHYSMLPLLGGARKAPPWQKTGG